MSNLKIYNYEGFPIQFDKVDGKIMANATLMAKAFNKEPGFVFKTRTWKEYELALMEAKNLRSEDIQSVRNGNNGGSWIHEELVMEFARRLNPRFSIWCNDILAELFRTGSVELPKKSEAEQILDVIRLLEVKVEQAKAEKEQVVKQLVEAKPKVEYFDKVINAEGLIPIVKIAQQLNMSARRLNEVLQEKKIQRKVKGTWVLTTPYLNKGYADLVTHPFTDANGTPRTAHHLQWTEKGRHFILETLGLVCVSV
jgi:phage antirepressor YoqD-like protein